MSRHRGAFFFVYACSGCAALVYEVAWTRLLTLRIGHTVAAVSTVLAAFMAGMAIGASAGGRLATRRSPREALRLYAWFEFVIAASAVALPLVLSAFNPLLAVAYADGAGGARFAFVRLALSGIALGIPCAAMGATFPIAARWIVDRGDRTGAAAGGLYAANTVGAAAGAALAAFVLLPALGLRMTTWLAALLNIGAGVTALWIASLAARTPSSVEQGFSPAAAAAPTAAPVRSAPRETRKRRNARDRAHAATDSAPAHIPTPRVAAFALAITGLVALVNEVAWTRVLALVIGPTTYAFGAMLAVFILGLAIGSAAAARLVHRIRHPRFALAIVMLAIGAAAIAVMPQVARMPIRVAEAVADARANLAGVMWTEALLTCALLLPLTIALGAAFPIAIAVATRDRDRAARDVAFVYTANTVGAIAGSLAGGFVLVPALGLHRTIVAAACFVAVSAIALVGGSDGRSDGGSIGGSVGGSKDPPLRMNASRARTIVVAVGATVVCILAWRSAPWDLELLSSGAYKYAPYVEGGDFESALRAGALLYYKDGAAATVSVRRVAGTVSLAIDGKVDASNAGDMLTQKLLGHLPLLLHPHPRRVAIIGLGSGVTLGAALRHPIERADMLEISREVVEASRFFAPENHDALGDPRTRLIVGDGRSHLLLGRARYDVIVSEPSNPWMAGIASLFTREFFEAARRALNPDGILCQWAHTYDISDADLRSIAATFVSVFPEATLWLVGEGDVLFIGSPSPILPRLDAIGASFARPGVAADLGEVSVATPANLLTLFAADPATLQTYARGAAIQTDDRTALEFSAPRSIFGRTGQDNAETIRALATTDRLPPIVRAADESARAIDWRTRGSMLLQAEAFRAAYAAFSRAVSLDPNDGPAAEGLTRSAGGANTQDEAVTLLTTIAAAHPQAVPVHVELSRLLASRGEIERAVETVRPLMVSLPADPRPAEQAASILADTGDTARLEPLVAHLVERWPDRPASAYYSATLAFMQGRAPDALRIANDGLRAHPEESRLHNLIGAAAAGLGRRDEARRAFEAAQAADPHDPTAHVNLGLFELEGGNPSAAVNHFSEALILDPRSERARQGLAEALARQRQ